MRWREMWIREFPTTGLRVVARAFVCGNKRNPGGRISLGWAALVGQAARELSRWTTCHLIAVHKERTPW